MHWGSPHLLTWQWDPVASTGCLPPESGLPAAKKRSCAEDFRCPFHHHDLPSGKPTKNYGKSPCFIGKSAISIAIFNSYVTNYQRVRFNCISSMLVLGGLTRFRWPGVSVAASEGSTKKIWAVSKAMEVPPRIG